jgi:Flp pilus assembly protein TadG
VAAVTRRRDWRDWRDDRGQVGGIEVLAFGFLVLVAGTLLMVNAWAVVDAKFAVTSAAREAARAYVEAPDETTARAAAEERAREALRAHGRDDASRTAVVVDAPEGFGRCRPVRVTVSYAVPALTVPFVGGFGEPFTTSATHGEVVDPYRDGLPEGGCP